MTDKELKELVASLAVSNKEILASIKELRENNKEIHASIKELRESSQETHASIKELRENNKEIQTSQKKFQENNQETHVSIEELRANNKEIQKQQEENWKQIKQVSKQIGEIGNKWGTFAEGMAIESIKKILRTSFNIPFTAQNVFKRLDNNEAIELDAFGYENSTVNTAVIVEIKSHLREDSIEQLEETMTKFLQFFPDHASKALYGIIACVHAPENLKNVLRKKGIYLAILNDDVFSLYPFKNFTPKDFREKMSN